MSTTALTLSRTARSGGVAPDAAVCALFALLLCLARPGRLRLALGGELADPDSYMRLVRLQEAFDSGHWFGDVVARDVSGGGVVLHWSHAFDALILLLRAPLRLALRPEDALFWAGALSGPVCLAAAAWCCVWAAAPLATRRWRWTAALAVAVSPGLSGYGGPGGATHHVALVALCVASWGGAGRAAFGDVRAGALAGLFAGLGIWVSPEALPFGSMGIAAIALSWALRPDRHVAAALAACGSALAATAAAGAWVDPPHFGRGFPQLDRISVVFLVLALLISAVCWLPVAARPRSLPARLALLGTAAALAACFWLMLYPGYLRGLAGIMSPEQASALFDHIAEMAPLTSAADIVGFGLGGAVAVLGACALAIARRGAFAGALWAFAACAGVVCLALAALHVRLAPYCEAGAALMLPVLLTEVSAPGWRRWRPLVRPGLIASVVAAPTLAGTLLTGAAAVQAHTADAAEAARCSVRSIARQLELYPGAVVLADVNLGPELLYRTDVKLVGTLYHQGIDGFMRLRAAWRARDLAAVPAPLRESGARFVLACPGAPRPALVDGPATTLFDRLNIGDPPPWLRPAAKGGGSGFTLYEVVQPAP